MEQEGTKPGMNHKTSFRGTVRVELLNIRISGEWAFKLHYALQAQLIISRIIRCKEIRFNQT